MDQSSAAACPKSTSSACADGDKVKKADNVSSSSCPFTANAPTNTECEASLLTGVNQDRSLSVDTEDSRRSNTGDVDKPAKPACEKKAACGGKSAREKKAACGGKSAREKKAACGGKSAREKKAACDGKSARKKETAREDESTEPSSSEPLPSSC